MFDGLKAAFQGWKTGSKYPSLSPDFMMSLAKPFADYFDQIDLLDYVGAIVCDFRSEWKPFTASYKLLPFTVAHFHINNVFYRRADVIAYSNEMIGAFLVQAFPAIGKVRLGDYIINDLEIQTVSTEFARFFKNINLNGKDFRDIEVEYMELVGFLFSYRTALLRHLFVGISKDEEDMGVVLKKLSIVYGQEIVKCSTETLTQVKVDVISTRVHDVIFNFIDATKSYKKYIY